MEAILNCKLSLLVAITCIQVFLGGAYANTAPQQKAIQFYAGMSGGFNQMAGRRSEKVFDEINLETTNFTNNLALRNTNAQYSGFLGISYFIPQTGIFIGPEIYLGKAHTEHRFQQTVFDPIAVNQRTLASTFSQSAFFGAVAKVGYSLASYSGYIVLGVEGSQFQNNVTYAPFAPDVPIFFKSRKWLTGLVSGFGLEKQVDCVRFGAEFRFVNYGWYRVNYNDAVTNETVNNLFRPKNVRFSLRVSYVF